MSVEMPRTVTTVVMRWPRSGCFDRYWQGWKGTLKHEVFTTGAGSDGTLYWSMERCWQRWKVTLK